MKRNDAVDWFADRMKENLEANCYKSGWHTMSMRTCLKQIENETEELRAAISYRERQKDVRPFLLRDKQIKKATQKVIRECADIANFAMFLAHNINDTEATDD